MNYKFPIIKSLSDVESVIENIDGIDIRLKDGYYNVCYDYISEDTFPPVRSKFDAIIRECRGLIFDEKSKEIIGRPLHKFFNVGEREETSINYTSNNFGNMKIEVKLDGSMVFPVLLNDKIVWMTKKGITDKSKEVQNFWDNYRVKYGNDEAYEGQIRNDLELSITPIFEFISPKNQIVVKYHKEELIYLTCREMNSGKYPKGDDLAYIRWRNISNYKLNTNDLHKLVKKINTITNFEGVILTQENGHRMKLKTDEYVKLHKIMSKFSVDRNLFSLWLDNGTDDIVSKIPDYLKDDLISKISYFHDISYNFLDIVHKFGYNRTTKKEFALSTEKSLFKSMVLQTWEDSYIERKDRVFRYLKKQLGSEKRFDAMIGGLVKNEDDNKV